MPRACRCYWRDKQEVPVVPPPNRIDRELVIADTRVRSARRG
jgi:hypothetical protein